MTLIKQMSRYNLSELLLLKNVATTHKLDFSENAKLYKLVNTDGKELVQPDQGRRGAALQTSPIPLTLLESMQQEARKLANQAAVEANVSPTFKDLGRHLQQKLEVSKDVVDLRNLMLNASSPMSSSSITPKIKRPVRFEFQSSSGSEGVTSTSSLRIEHLVSHTERNAKDRGLLDRDILDNHSGSSQDELCLEIQGVHSAAALVKQHGTSAKACKPLMKVITSQPSSLSSSQEPSDSTERIFMSPSLNVPSIRKSLDSLKCGTLDDSSDAGRLGWGEAPPMAVEWSQTAAVRPAAESTIQADAKHDKWKINWAEFEPDMGIIMNPVASWLANVEDSAPAILENTEQNPGVSYSTSSPPCSAGIVLRQRYQDVAGSKYKRLLHKYKSRMTAAEESVQLREPSPAEVVAALQKRSGAQETQGHPLWTCAKSESSSDVIRV